MRSVNSGLLVLKCSWLNKVNLNVVTCWSCDGWTTVLKFLGGCKGFKKDNNPIWTAVLMKTVPQTRSLFQIQFPTDPRRQTDLWSCSAGLQRCSRRSGREQRFAGLGSRRLHKYRLADVCGAESGAASCAAWLKQRVGLSWGRLKASAERYTGELKTTQHIYHSRWCK